MRLVDILITIAAIASSSAAIADETITYTYDARGRLTAVAHSGTANNGTQVSYTLDAAGNRKNTMTTGVVNLMIVVPLNGLTPIRIKP
jgi:hypothetical protein